MKKTHWYLPRFELTTSCTRGEVIASGPPRHQLEPKLYWQNWCRLSLVDPFLRTWRQGIYWIWCMLLIMLLLCMYVPKYFSNLFSQRVGTVHSLPSVYDSTLIQQLIYRVQATASVITGKSQSGAVSLRYVTWVPSQCNANTLTLAALGDYTN